APAASGQRGRPQVRVSRASSRAAMSRVQPSLRLRAKHIPRCLERLVADPSPARVAESGPARKRTSAAATCLMRGGEVTERIFDAIECTQHGPQHKIALIVELRYERAYECERV